MHDINLFERFKPKPKKTNYLKLLVFLVFVLLIAFIAFNEFRFYSKRNQLNKDIEMIQEFTNSPETKAKIEEITEKQKLSQELSDLLAKVVFVDGYMKANNIVHNGLLTAISTSAPQNCFIDGLTIASTSLTLNGFADSYESVADFQHNLRKTGKLSMVFNPSISEENANYAFSFAAQISRGVEYED